MYNRKRNVRIEFRVTDEEREQIAQRMAQAGAVNANAYLRKMAIDGMIIRLDLPELNELVSLLRRCSNNINQLAKRVNETGRFYQADMEGLHEQMEELWEEAKKILVALSAVE